MRKINIHFIIIIKYLEGYFTEALFRDNTFNNTFYDRHYKSFHSI